MIIDGEPTLRTSEAARVLGISPNTLRSWGKRYGFPQPKRSPGGHRRYSMWDIQRLKDALLGGATGESACEWAQQTTQPVKVYCPRCMKEITRVIVRAGHGELT
jgi:hypothetical protein